MTVSGSSQSGSTLGGKDGGGGSGGSILVEADKITNLYSASAPGGNGGRNGGAGSLGRIAVYYLTEFFGNFTPGYLEKAGAEDTIFHDGFEEDGLNTWSSNVNDSGDLTASNSADYWFDYGMSAVIDDNTSIYVQDDSPNNEAEYRARFYMNPNSVTMVTNDVLDLFTGYKDGTAVFRVQMQKTATSYQIRAGLLSDAGAWTESSWYDISTSWNAVEIDYQAFINSGSLTLWLNDVQKQSILYIDNDTRPVTEVRLGAQGIETGTRGTLYFDDFDSRRFSYIGTLPEPGVYDPQATNPKGWETTKFEYEGTAIAGTPYPQPHAVTKLVRPDPDNPTNPPAELAVYEYDENGNMTCRKENGDTYKQNYNAENRISSIAKINGDCDGVNLIEVWTYTYDGDGVRVSTAHFTGLEVDPDAFTAYYMGGMYETQSNGTIIKYYSIAGQTVAVNTWDTTLSRWNLSYLLTDHLGSVVASTDVNGTLISQQRYLPFGGARTDVTSPNDSPTDFTYTGQRDLPGTGLMDYKARMFSPYHNLDGL